MIQQNELRIGNYVKSITHNEIIQINIIDKYKTYDTIEAVPLTEEWLLKFGFVKDEALQIYRNDETESTIIIDYDFNCLLGYSTAKLQYVHRFQNLMFELIGKELEYVG